MKKKILAIITMCLSFCASATNSWTYDATAKTITDGVWKFNASVKNTTNLTVGTPVEEDCPTSVTALDFSGTVVDSADGSVHYTIVNLNMTFDSYASKKVLVGELTLPGEGLTTISGKAFKNCTAMTGDLEFPASITSVGGEAFLNSRITSIHIPPTTALCSIAGGYGSGGGFYQCGELRTIKIDAGGAGVKLATGSTTGKCGKLLDADLSGVTIFDMYHYGQADNREFNNGYAHFSEASSLTNVTIGANVSVFPNNALFGNNINSIKTVRFLGPPPSGYFSYPLYFGVSKTHTVTTIIPSEYIEEWGVYAENGELATAGTTWKAECVSNVTDLAYRPLVLDKAAAGSLPQILSVTIPGYKIGATEASVKVEGMDLLGGTVSITVYQNEIEVAKLEDLTDFGFYTITGLSGGTAYTVVATAENENGSDTSDPVAFSTFPRLAEPATLALYDPASKVFGFYNDDVDRSGIANVISYPITGASTWASDTTIRAAERVYIHPSFASFRPPSCKQWFENLSHVYEFEGLEYINTVECKNFAQMFNGCSSVAVLDMSTFKTINGTDMLRMFAGCSLLGTIYANENFSMQFVESYENMFLNDTSLRGGNGTAHSNTHQNGDYARIDDPTHGKPGYFTYKAPAAASPTITSVSAQAVSNDVATVVVKGYNLQGGTVEVSLYDGATKVASVDTNAFVSIGFSGLARATVYTVKITVENATGSTVDDEYSFTTWGTTTLAPRAVYTAFDHRLVFYYDDVDRSSVSTVYEFNNNNTKTWSEVNTSVTEIIFDPSFKAFRTKTCDNWFSYFRGLGDLGIRFSGWENLNTSQATSMARMFYYCHFIGDPPDMTHFDTRKVTSFQQFTTYGGWTVMDCSSFDTRSATNMSDMFHGCTTIYANENFTVSNVTASTGMFNSNKIVGGAGTVYDANHTDKEYARIDDPDHGLPGYFTYKAPPPKPGLKIVIR